MAETGHPLQIVRKRNSLEYVFEEAELERLLLREDVRDLPVVVVSVAGAYRGGNSFLLNFFIRYLSSPASAREDGSWLGQDSDPLTGFQWRNGIRVTTTGLLMWSEPLITTLPTGEKVAVLLLDTEGLRQETSAEEPTMFRLSTLVSSIQIYSVSHNITEDDLQQLKLLTEYGKLMDDDSETKAFQVLEFVVRDWQFPEDYSYGAVGGETLLQERLEITNAYYMPAEMKKLRKNIVSCFEKVSCFLMPHPGFKVLQSNFRGNLNDISPEFKTQLVELAKSILSPEKLIPKKINGHQIKTRDLIKYILTYTELFNRNPNPGPSDIRMATVKAGLKSVVDEAFDLYEKRMQTECGPTELGMPAIDLKFVHNENATLSRTFYTNKTKMGSETQIAECLRELNKKLSVRLPQYLQSNTVKIETTMGKARDTYKDVFQNISQSEMFCVHQIDLGSAHKTGSEAALKTYEGARRRMTQQSERELSILNQEIDNLYVMFKNINDQNNKYLISEIEMDYWQKMEPKTALYPPLSEVDFKSEHNTALVEALEKFESRRNKPNQYTEDVYKYTLTKHISDKYNELKVRNNNRIQYVALIVAEQERLKIDKEKLSLEERDERKRVERLWHIDFHIEMTTLTSELGRDEVKDRDDESSCVLA